MDTLLAALKKDGLKIGIASSKPQKYIEMLLERFNVMKYFDCVCGVSFTADCESKASIITRCMTTMGVNNENTFMVGDKSTISPEQRQTKCFPWAQCGATAPNLNL